VSPRDAGLKQGDLGYVQRIAFNDTTQGVDADLNERRVLKDCFGVLLDVTQAANDEVLLVQSDTLIEQRADVGLGEGMLDEVVTASG